MATTTESAEPTHTTESAESAVRVERGAHIASELGWPRDQMGLLGAVGGLVDVARPYRRPRSALYLVERRRRQSQLAVYRRVLRSMARYGEFD